MRSCLIVGQNGAFNDFLIDRFLKEDWRVCTLSESGAAPKKVFQHYKCSFSSDDLSRVFESSRPNLVIYMGAYDNAYRGSNHKVELKRKFVSNVSNLLLCSGQSGVRHFVYLSSDQVFDKNIAVNITEDMVPQPETEHGVILRQGEMLVLEYNRTANMETTVVRLSNLFFAPSKAVDCVDTVTARCLAAAKGDTVVIDSNFSYSILHSGDAVEALYRLVSSEKRQRNLYHIASDQILDDNELLKVIQSEFARDLSVRDDATGASQRRVLNGDAFCREFDFRARVDYRKAVPEIIRGIQASLSKFLKDSDTAAADGKEHTLSRTVFIIAEAVAAVLVCFFLTVLFKYNDALSSIDLYLLCSLLFAAYYGSKAGVLTASLSTVVWFVYETHSRSGLSALIDMKTYTWIAQLFIVALAVGYIRDSLTQVRKEFNLETEYLNDKLENIDLINKSNVKIKDFFEERVVDSNGSVGYVYDIIQVLDNAKQIEVMFEATRILTQMMEAGSVSIYQVLENGYLRVVSSTSERSRSLGKSIRKDSLAAVFEQIDSKQEYVNRSLDSDLPNMIGCLTDINNNVTFIVMLWDMKYDHMTLYYLNLLKVICKLISNAVARSVEFLEVTKGARFIQDTSILNDKAFREVLEAYQRASKAHLTEYSLLSVKTSGKSLSEVSDTVKKFIRFTDSMGTLGTDALLVLLTNTNNSDANIVVKRLTDHGLDVSVVT